ncbi:hypothetical protein PWT90_01292 [Aphanocladium album]|nr:hypothetical protein PWT90_01292 [Aphanocladium album]
MGCRLAGAVDTPEKLWELVSAARNTWSPRPSDGRGRHAFHHPRSETLGTNHSQGSHFLDHDVAACDISFFSFTPDVARSMDPQVRLLLETVFEALEFLIVRVAAGITLKMAASSRTSVFAGAAFHDYQDILMQDIDNLPRYYLTGNAPAMLANRISHFFNLRGPSVTVDSACSTGTAALHLACQSLRAVDSSMAVVGGANLILSPSSSIGLSTLGLTGPTGKTFSFDERASGYGRGEGVGCLLLKPLDDAIRDGDPIRAVVRETAMNQDGNTLTITSPSPQAQEEIMKQCYVTAGLDPHQTGYVECHGTGTLVGDKVETASVAKVFAAKKSMHGPLYIGSAKANFGHTGSTSGITAVIKVVKMLEANLIAPQALFSNPNPEIDFDNLNIKWPEMGHTLIDTYPVFRKAIDDAQACLSLLGAEWNIVEELVKPEATSRLAQPYLSFPGEISAAYAAGILTFEEAVTVAYLRGRLTSDFVNDGRIKGGMPALGTGEGEALQILENLGLASELVVACINSPSNVTLAGTVQSLDAVSEWAKSKSIFYRRLNIPVEYHSSQMECLSEEYLMRLQSHLPDHSNRNAGEVCPINKVHFVSPVTGKSIGKAVQSIRAPQHWIQNMVQSVKFNDAVRAQVFDDSEIAGVDTIIEIGPHGALQGAMRQILSSSMLPPSKVSLQYSLKRGTDSTHAMQTLAGTLHSQRFPVNLQAVNFPSWDSFHDRLRVVTDLPTYAWDHKKRYWVDSVRVRESLERKQRRHYLLGTRLHGPNPNINVWRNTFRVDDMPWVQDHLLHSEFFFPGAGMIVMVLFAMSQIDEANLPSHGTYAIHDLNLHNGVIVPRNSAGIDIQLTIQSQDNSRLLEAKDQRVFDFYSHDGRGNWTSHCQGIVTSSRFPSLAAFAQRYRSFNRSLAPIDVLEFYHLLEETAPSLGPAFRHLSSLVCGDRFAEAIAIVPDITDATLYGNETELWLHPTLLDSLFQVAWAAVDRESLTRLGLCIPNFAKQVDVARGFNLAPGTRLHVVVFLDQLDNSGFEVSLFVLELDGENTKRLILRTSGLRISSLSGGSKAPLVDNSVILQSTSEAMPIPPFSNTDASEGKISFPWPPISLQYPGSVSSPFAELVRESLQSRFDVDVTLETLGQSTTMGKITVFLDDVNGAFLSICDSMGFKNLKRVLLDAETVLWVSRSSDVSAEAAMHIGLLGTLRLEHGDKKYISLDSPIETEDADSSALKSAEAISDVLRHVTSASSPSGFIHEFRLRSESLHHLDYQPAEKLNNEYSLSRGDQGELRASQYSWFSDNYLRLVAKDHGMLDSLSFAHDNTLLQSMPLEDDMVEIAPHSFGLNFRDVLVAMGETEEGWMGFECAGYVTQIGAAVSSITNGVVIGARICCLMQGGHWANRIRVPLTCVVPIPDTMTFELAVSIPMCFVTAYYGLVECGRLEADETVLIHAGAGGVGQAAIAIAQSVGARVFATVGSDEEKAYLLKHYGLLEEKIFSSLNSDFREKVLRATAGCGVDVLLNSLAGPLLQAGWDSMASCGRFIELGKSDAKLSKTLDMRKFGDAASYMLLTFGEQLGKSVITVQSGDQVWATPSHVSPPELDEDGCYLIAGGTSGVGLEIARWMSCNGAGHLMLVSRNAANPKNTWIRDEIEAAGKASVSLISCDVTSMDDLARAVHEYDNLSQQKQGRKTLIRGVIQSAAVLDDGIFENMSFEQWKKVVRPKVQGTRNLDLAFQDADLDFFIILSSVTAILGSGGQANYTAAGTFQDALAARRVSSGRPAVSINIGSVSTTGLAARAGVVARLEKAGYRTQDVSEVLSLVALAIRHPHQGQMVTGIRTWSSVEDLSWRRQPRFACLRTGDGDRDDAAAGAAATGRQSWRDKLAAAKTSDESVAVLTDAVKQRLADIFGQSAEDFDAALPPATYGIDSLVAVELRNWLHTNIVAGTSIFDITQSKSITDLAMRLEAKLAAST